MRRFAFGLGVLVCALGARDVGAEPTQPVFLGIVAEELREVVPQAADRRALRVEGNVTRLDFERVGTTSVARCEVSLLLLEMPGGSLRAILRGQSEVRGPRADSLEERVVRSAVRRALRPLRDRIPLASR